MSITLRASGTTLVWSPEFRAFMQELCVERELPDAVPICLLSVALRGEGMVLLWPGTEQVPDSHAVRISHGGRRITTDLAEPLAELGVILPEGVVIGIPAVRWDSDVYGLCIGLRLPDASFLYRRSRASAIGLQPE